MELAILVPVLNRPHRVAPLLASIRESTSCAHLVLFICSPGDTDELDELRRCSASLLILAVPPSDGDYARKINAGFKATATPWIFTGADDLKFHSGWWEATQRFRNNARVSVIGTQDLGNRRVLLHKHSTHSLVRRSYVEKQGTIDEPGKVLHEGYPHEFVDDEFIETAKERRAFAFCPDAIVEHLHPLWGKAEWDSLYEAHGKRMLAGRALYKSRRRLWIG